MDEASLTKELRRVRRVRTRLQKEEGSPSEADLDTALLLLWHSIGDMHLGAQYLSSVVQGRRRDTAQRGM